MTRQIIDTPHNTPRQLQVYNEKFAGVDLTTSDFVASVVAVCASVTPELDGNTMAVSALELVLVTLRLHNILDVALRKMQIFHRSSCFSTTIFNYLSTFAGSLYC